jgi:hypothetical protein
MNFTLPEQTAERLKALVSERKRSAFVASAVEEKLAQLEKSNS